jgi:LuxR family maltose regulon positive regulatory protein
MIRPLLRTKLHIPQPPSGLILRPHLYEKLDDVLSKKLCLVSTPAGYGKTTLIASWANQGQQRLVWVSLDEEDNDFSRFFTYVITSIQSIEAGFSEGLLMRMISPQPLLPERFLTYLVNELYEIEQDFVLVLDDFHWIQDEAIQEGIEYLVENSPPQIHLVIASRTDLPFSIANLRAQDQIVEFTQYEMRFSEEEALRFLNKRMGLKLSWQDARTLIDHTEGWIVGLQLAAHSLEYGKSTRIFFQDLSDQDHYIREYLMDEVFSCQSEEVQDFLLRSSICNRFTAEMCDAILDIDCSSNILDNLERSNLFIVPLDRQQKWYRYHHLFAEMLISRLKREFPESIPSLNRSASIWCESEGLNEEAIEYAVRAKDYPRAARLIEKVGKGTLWTGNLNQLLRWLNALPEVIYQDSFSLRPLLLWTLINAGKFSVAADKLEAIQLDENTLNRFEEDERMKYQGWMATLRALIAMNTRYDFSSGLKEARLGIDNTHEQDEFGLMAPLIYGKACMWAADLESAEPYLKRGLVMMKRIGSPFLIMVATHHLGEFSLLKGDLRRAEDFLQEAYDYGLQHDFGDSSAFGRVSIDLGRLHFERADLIAAQNYLSSGVRIAERYKVPYDLLEGNCALFDLACHERKLELSRQWIWSVEELGKSCGFPRSIMERAEAMRARLALVEGKWRVARRWLQETHLLDQPRFEFYQSYHVYTAIRTLYAHQELAPAKDLASRMLAMVEGQHRAIDMIHLKAWLAIILDRLGEFQASNNIIEEIVEIGSHEGYIHSVVDVGNPIVDLLVRFKNHREHDVREREPDFVDAYLQELISAQIPKALNGSIRGVGFANSMVELLTEREMEVLQRLAEGHSNRELADSMDITQSTVKFHLKNIYLKLGARSRTQAIARAGELHLI